MKYILFLSISILSSYYSLADNNAAIEYNDKIVNEQTKIGESILTFSNNPNNFTLSLMKQQAEKSLAVLRQMEPFEGNKELLNSAKNLFKFYAGITDKEYKSILEIIEHKNEYSSSEITSKINKLSNSITEKEAPLDKAFEQAQLAFAQKYNFDLRKNELMEKIEKAKED